MSSDTPLIPPVLLKGKLDHEYDDQDRRGLLAIIGTYRRYLRRASERIEALEADLSGMTKLVGLMARNERLDIELRALAEKHNVDLRGLYDE